MRSVRDFEVAKHEAGHVAAARLLGWDVQDSERFRVGGGLTHVDPPEDFGDARERGIESGVILLSAITLSPDGSGEDHQKLGELAEAGIPVGVVYRQTSELLASEPFRALHARLTDALWAKPRLERADLEKIFARPDAAASPPSSGAVARSS